MELRLYKEPHIDPVYPDIVRLLFEGKAPDAPDPDDVDFYMYVWIHKNGNLRGFQAVLGDRVALGYHVPMKKTFGRLARDILDRGITQTETPQDREQLLSAIRDTANEHFPVLIEYIKRLADGEGLEQVVLNPKEMTLFSNLVLKK